MRSSHGILPWHILCLVHSNITIPCPNAWTQLCGTCVCRDCRVLILDLLCVRPTHTENIVATQKAASSCSVKSRGYGDFWFQANLLNLKPMWIKGVSEQAHIFSQYLPYISDSLHMGDTVGGVKSKRGWGWGESFRHLFDFVWEDLGSI